jgi:hypothetical protein
VYFFGCYQGKPFLKIESHLVTEGTDSACTGAIGFANSMIENMMKQLMVLLHKKTFYLQK